LKRTLITVVFASAALGAAAQQSNVGCGLGSAVFNGQSGVFPQVLAATTNGSSGNQTFGISFGTLGCTQDGVVKSSMKISLFIDSNRLTLARDAASGRGESLQGLMAVMAVKPQDQAAMTALLKERFTVVFADERVAANLKLALAADARLAAYAQAI
jgi:Protein of unknown function (DUF3015)